jgi:hypothetical protein
VCAVRSAALITAFSGAMKLAATRIDTDTEYCTCATYQVLWSYSTLSTLRNDVASECTAAHVTQQRRYTGRQHTAQLVHRDEAHATRSPTRRCPDVTVRTASVVKVCCNLWSSCNARVSQPEHNPKVDPESWVAVVSATSTD